MSGIIDRGIFRAKSGMWWANSPLREGHASSLHTRNEVEAKARYAEMLAFYQKAFAKWHKHYADENRPNEPT